MAEHIIDLNSEVTKFLDELNHPLRQEIDYLRSCVLMSNTGLTENVKWNGPNYCIDNEDRITMRIQPLTAKKIQLIFHRGVKVQEQPKERLIQKNVDFLTWKTNDRAIATFKNRQDIEKGEADLIKFIGEWIAVTK